MSVSTEETENKKNLVGSNDINIVSSGDDISLELTNAIKQALTTSVVSSYSENNSDVYNAPYINGLNGKILWTNPSPTANISTETINLSSNDYDRLEIIYKSATNINNIRSIIMLKGYNSIMIGYSPNMTYSNYYRRQIEYVDDTTLSVGIGHSLSPSQGQSDNDAVCIPLYVVGYKTGLFD